MPHDPICERGAFFAGTDQVVFSSARCSSPTIMSSTSIPKTFCGYGAKDQTAGKAYELSKIEYTPKVGHPRLGRQR